MKKPIHKSSVSIHLSYFDGGYTNNLNCDNVSIETNANTVIYAIDLGCNLRVRSKISNCYYDVCEFLEENARLRMLQIFDDESYQVVRKAAINNKNAKWFLEIIVGDKGSYKYDVIPHGKNNCLEFQVQNKEIT